MSNKKIIGVTVGTTKPRANFGQTDPKKSDYIKNRPVAKTEAMTQPVGVDENGDLWTVPPSEGINGKDGGHYIPSVNDNGNGTMTVSFAASKSGMPTVNPITITLPVPADGEDGQDGQDGANGKDGENGGYYTPSVNTVTANTFKISFAASKSGMPAVGDVTITIPAAKDGEDGKDGTNGANGQDGADGVGIESIVQTTTSTADGGENVITVTLTNGNKSTFKVKNGSKGNTGATGATGADGKDGSNGKDGADGVGIKSIAKTSTSGLVDTYTITLTNNTTITFTVTNGKAGTNGTNGTNGKDGYTPVKGVDYWTPEDIAAMDTDNKEFIIRKLAELNQQKIPVVNSMSEMTDTDLLYLMVKDGSLWYYAYTKVYKPAEPLFTNVLPTAIDTDGSIYNGIGYKDGWRTSESDGSYKEEAGCTVTGFIACNKGDIVYMRGISIHSGRSQAMPYNSSFARYGNPMYGSAWTKLENGDLSFTVTLGQASGYINIVGKTPFADDAIISLNNPIAYSDPVEAFEWTAIQPLVYTDHTADIQELQDIAEDHDKKINKLLSGNTDAVDIRDWDKPVYDAAPVTLLGDDRAKPALTSADYSVDAVYARYDALVSTHPKYVTTNPDNYGESAVNIEKAPKYKGHDLRYYEFCEPSTLAEPGSKAYETKPKIILMSGVHEEWAGVYGLYYALEEITTNPDFDDVRRNAHLIVIPCANPFVLSKQTVSGWTTTHVNANGVAIHNNFGVDHSSSGTVGAYNYGGASPYSEPETVFIDNIVKANKDAIAFITCHSAPVDSYYNTRVMWGSSATPYMCNLITRLVDKLTKAWLTKYGDTLRNAITDKWAGDANAVDYRLGYAQMSTSAGTEQKNAIQYNIQATNLELIDTMPVFSNTEHATEVMTHGAEVYANWIRTILAAYDYNDKKAYAFIE